MESISIRIGHIKPTGEVRGTDAEMKTLKDSMKEVGQLQDIVLNSRHEIIAGRRRYEAMKQLGGSHIRAVVLTNLDDALKAAKAERDENAPGCRVSLNRKQQLELAKRLEELENPEAAKRKAASQAKKGVGKAGAGKLPAPEQKGRVRDKVGEIIGMSGSTLERAQSVVNAGQEHPHRYLDLAEKVQEDKQPIDPLYQEYKARKEVYDAADKDGRFLDIAAKLIETRDTEAATAEYEKRRDEQSKDRVGNVLPKRLVKVFNDGWVKKTVDILSQMILTLDRELCIPLKKKLDREDCPALAETVLYLRDAINEMIEARASTVNWEPYAVCPKCAGNYTINGCTLCHDSGWLTKQLYTKQSEKRQPLPS